MAGKFGITVLGSGSRGNAAVIHGPEGCLLLDAGFSARELEKRLGERSIAPSSLRALLLTHGHADHTKGCRVFADRYRIRTYLTEPTLREGARAHFLPGLRTVVTPGAPFELCGMRVEPFTLPHDAVDTVGYIFQADGKKIGVATDLGHLNLTVRRKLRDCSLLMLEANHEPALLQVSARPLRLKRRILSRQGHLSNQDAMAALGELLTPRSVLLILAHLSEECNRRVLVAALVEKTLADLGRQDILFKIAGQSEPLDTCWLTE